MQQRGKKGNTDDLLAASFKELLCKAPMEKITIKDITDKAGVIRPTFYNHFTDKYARLDRQIIAEYYANSMCYVAIAWIKRDYMISPKDLSEVYKYLTKSSMMDVLNELV